MMKLKKNYVAGILSLAIVGTALIAGAPAQATHQIGHAILGGIIGGVIGNAIINRNNNYYNDRRPNDYGVQVYQQPRRAAPVYIQQPRRCWWQNNTQYDAYGRQVIRRVRVCS